MQAILGGISGRGEVTGEQLVGQLILQVRVDPKAIARYGVPTRNVLNVVGAVGSRRVGDVREGQRRCGSPTVIPSESEPSATGGLP